MLGAASIFDVRTRKIPDVIWMIFGGMGAVLYIWDYGDVTYEILTMIVTGAIAILVFMYRIAGIGDVFAILSIAIILPVHYGFVMMPITVLVASFLLVIIFVIMYNASLNVSDMIRSRKLIFSEFNEPKYRKAFAFLSTHRKRKYERFVVSAESSMSITPDVKTFVFVSLRNRVKRNSHLQSNRVYVQIIPSLTAYMFGVAVFLLLPEILSILFF